MATVCALTFAIATGKLDLSIQGLFGAGKSRAAAILIAGLLALDPERRLRYQLLCKKNTGTKSFIEVLLYLKLPADVFKRVGRLISDGKANKSGQSTSKDLPHTTSCTVRQKRMPECDLLVMTGGTHTSDRTSYWSRLEEWQRNLAFTVVDEAQQFGTDREVTAIAMLPPTSFILWTGDAQQTLGGIAKAITLSMLVPDSRSCPGDMHCHHPQRGPTWGDTLWTPFFFLRLPYGQYGPVSQLSRSEESCTGPFNWGEAHCAGEKVKRKIGPFLRKSLKNQTRTRTQQKGRSPPRQPGTPWPGSQVHGPTRKQHNKQETSPTNLSTP